AARSAFAAFGNADDAQSEREGAIAAAAEERRLRGIPERYFVYTGRYDARQDLTTLLRALRLLAADSPPATSRRGRHDEAVPTPQPPHVVLLGATTDDRSEVARAAAHESVGDLLSYT